MIKGIRKSTLESWNKPAKSAAELLERTLKLVGHHTRWTKSTFARNKNGARTLVLSPEAAQFCLLGAITRTQDGTKGEIVAYTRELLAKAIDPFAYEGCYHTTIFGFNDEIETNHRRITRKLRKAISMAKKQGK